MNNAHSSGTLGFIGATLKAILLFTLQLLCLLLAYSCKIIGFLLTKCGEGLESLIGKGQKH